MVRPRDCVNDRDDSGSAMGKQNPAKYCEIPTSTGVQASKIFGWVYKYGGWYATSLKFHHT